MEGDSENGSLQLTCEVRRKRSENEQRVKQERVAVCTAEMGLLGSCSNINSNLWHLY